MLIGVPRETKVHEYRVGLTPESVRELARDGHQLMVEHDAGAGIGASDGAYRDAGASIAATAREVFARAELLIKVKEPLAPERPLLRPRQTLFTYLHLASDPQQARELIASGAIALAYETVTAAEGGLPLLAPMSIVASRMSIQVAAHYMERPNGGRGVLIAGVEGMPPARILVLGAGKAGTAAALTASGIGGSVCVLDRSEAALRRVARLAGSGVETALMAPEILMRELAQAEAVIGAALVPGAAAPKLVTRPMLRNMNRGTILVDISIDQGGCFETSHPTTHAEPVYEVDGIIHYCVANIPGAVPRTSTYALNRATLPFVKRLAGLGIAAALRGDPHLLNGLNVCAGALTSGAVAKSLRWEFTPPLEALGRAFA